MPLNFETLFNSLQGLYLILTPELNIAAVNDAYLKATMTEREKIVGRNIFEVFPDNPNDPSATGENNLRASLGRVLKNKTSDTMAVQKYDIRRPESEGGGFEERYWSPINSPLFEAGSKKISYIIHKVEDVTEFIRLKQHQTDAAEKMEAEIFQRAQELQTANQKLRENASEIKFSNQELESFSYSVSHDLRAPLRHLDGFVNLLRGRLKDVADEKAVHYLTVIANAAKQMGELIDALLAFSKMGRTEIRRQKISMAELTDKVVLEIKENLNGRKIEWKIAPLPETTGDPVLIRQVLVNLISNAAKYTQKQENTVIEIGVLPGETPEKETVFFVRDNGVGFDPEYSHKLFNVFQRLHSNEEFEGTGIGLANVRRIIARHGGKTWAESKSGQGAAFYFSLPV